MESTKVTLRDKVTARLGGNLLRVEGSQVHVLSLNLNGHLPAIQDSEAINIAKSLITEIRRRYQEVQMLRNCNVLLEISIHLNDNNIGDRGLIAIVSALHRVSDISCVPALHIHGNPDIADTGAAALARFILQVPNKLKELSLSKENLQPQAIEGLRKSVEKRGTKLRFLPGKIYTHSKPKPRFSGPTELFVQHGPHDNVLALRLTALSPPIDDEECISRLGHCIAAEVRKIHSGMNLPTTGTLLELKLTLSKNQIGNRGTEALIMALTSLQDIAWTSELSLDANRITCIGAKAVAAFLRKALRPVSEINLCENSVSDAGATALLEAAARRFPVNENLLWLRLESNRIDANAVLTHARDVLKVGVCIASKKSCTRNSCSIAREFQTAVHVPRFLMQRRQIERTADDSSSQLLTKLGGSNSNEYRLLLDGRNPPLDDDGTFEVAVRLSAELSDFGYRGRSPISLDLCLDDNNIGDRGVLALVGVLLHAQDTAKLRLFSICRNNIGNDGLRAIADLIRRSRWPTSTIALSHNRISDCATIIDAIGHRKNSDGDQQRLQLHLSCNPIPMKDFQTLVSYGVIIVDVKIEGSKKRDKKHAKSDTSLDNDQVRKLKDQVRLLSDKLSRAKMEGMMTQEEGVTLLGSESRKKKDEAKSLKKSTAKKQSNSPPKVVKKPVANTVADKKKVQWYTSAKLTDAMIAQSYSARHARWTEAALLRCQEQVQNTRWVLGDRNERWYFDLDGPTLNSQKQQELQDCLLTKGCVAMISKTKKKKHVVMIVALAHEHGRLEVDALKALVSECLPPKVRITHLHLPEGVKEEVADKNKEEQSRQQDVIAVPTTAASDGKVLWGDDDDDDDEDDTEAVRQAIEKIKIIDTLGDSLKADIDLLTAEDRTETTSATTLIKTLKSGVGAKLLEELRQLEAQTWEYVGDAIEGKIEAESRSEFLVSLLDAFLPSFQGLKNESQTICVEAVVDTTRKLAHIGSSLSDILMYVHGVMVSEGSESSRSMSENKMSVSSIETTVSRRWEGLVLKLLERKRTDMSTYDAGIVYAGVLLYWYKRVDMRKQQAVSVLRRASGKAFSDTELAQAWKDRNYDLAVTVNWFRFDVSSSDQSASKAKVDLQRGAAELEEEKRRRRRRVIEERERRETRNLVVERFAQRPGTSGWRATIKAKTFVYGSDNSKIRYLDGKIVTTTGQKQIMIREGPEMGQGNLRYRKGSTGTLRCAAAGSKGAS